MTATGSASASSLSAFTVGATNVLNQKAGLLFYGFGAVAQPFQGGTRCVAAPNRRTPLQSSGGTAFGNDCSGAYGLDFNAWIRSGIDPQLVPGAAVFCQYWSRDPGDLAGFGTGLTNATSFSIDL